jgi:membrane protein DedA with SNARE-associated domain
MCGAFFIATGSFFLGQADEIPQALRVMPALTLLAVTPLIVMVYWVRRLKRKRRTEPELNYGATTSRFSTV